MPSYIALSQFTQQGIENVKQSPARLDAFKQVLQAAGGRLKAFYLTMGQYDIVCVFDLPDDETAAKVALTLGSKGNIRTQTLRAFTEEEYRKIIAGLP
ncbi:MAG: GYD domain-containing protein [Acidobacteriota bacterium]